MPGAGLVVTPALDHARIVEQSAAKYHIPSWVLFGVWGMETGFGNNVATSSAGAEGNFQFIPGTARSYGYPMTNSPTPGQFQAQADAAAHYLSDLYRQHGSWDTALHLYSGGGYGAAQVQAKAGKKPIDPGGGGGIPTIPIPFGGLKGLQKPFTDVSSALSAFWGGLTDPHTWLRIAMGIFALFLLAFGLFELAGGRGDMVTRRLPV